MNILVTINIAATDDRVEFLIPTHRFLYELIPDIIRQIEKVCKNVLIDSNCPLLYERERGMFIDLTKNAEQAGLRQGSSLSIL